MNNSISLVKRDTITQKVCELIANILSVDIDLIKPDLELDGRVGKSLVSVDSFDYVQIIIAIEEEFAITVEFDVAFLTVGDIIEYVISNIN